MILSDSAYKYSTTITHQGVVLAFAARSNGASPPLYQIGYTALALASTDPGAGWTSFQTLNFPTELRPAGMRLLTFDFSISATKGVPAADAPFQVLSDGLHVYVFRQSAQNTLLADRFVWDGVNATLTKTWEVRYRRSGNPDLPAGPADTFGSTNMADEHFIEPTTELGFINNLGTGASAGWFSVLILPTSLNSVSRWQIFAYNSTSQTLNSFSILRASDGLFDLSDLIVIDELDDTVSILPNAQFQITSSGGSTLAIASGPASLLYTRQEQIVDENGQPHLFKKDVRTMVALGVLVEPNYQIAILDSAVGKDGKIAQIQSSAYPAVTALPVSPAPTLGTCLSFSASCQTQVTAPDPSNLSSSELTIEAWVRLAGLPATGQLSLIIQGGSDVTPSFVLNIVDDGSPIFSIQSNCVCGPSLKLATWYHLAGVWDGTSATLYVNGWPYLTAATASAATVPSTGIYFGNPPEDNNIWVGFTGSLDEVRLWSVARSQAQILAAMCTAIDPGSTSLAAYWPMNEPTGQASLTTVPDASASGSANGTLIGATWAPSGAPIGASMPPIAWDANGLDMETTLLPFASASAPFLFAGGDGLVHLYFQNADNSQNAENYFYAAHYDALNARANYVTAWAAADPDNSNNSQQGSVRFIARQAGSGMNLNTVSPTTSFVQIEAATGATECTVTLLSYTSLQEVWSKVPVELNKFLAVLGGNAILPSDESPVTKARKLIVYDYGTNVAVSDEDPQYEPHPAPGLGSGIFNVTADTFPTNGIAAIVLPTTASTPAILDLAGLDCRWTAVPAPPSLSLNGSSQYVQIANPALTLKSQLCLEAWIYPAGGDTVDQSGAIIYLNASGSDTTLPTEGFLGIYNNTYGNTYLVAGNSTSQAKYTTAGLIQPSTWTHVAANYKRDFGIQLSGQTYLDAGNNASLTTTDGLTVEAWVKLDQVNLNQMIMAKGGLNQASWSLSIGTDNIPVFTVVRNNGSKSQSTVQGTALSNGQWYYIAATYDVRSERVGALQNIEGYASIGAIADPPSTAMTVEAWITLSPSPGQLVVNPQIIFWGGTNPVNPFNYPDDASFALTWTPTTPSPYGADGLLTFNVFYATNWTRIYTNITLAIGSWVHVAATYNDQGGLATGLYVNGALVASNGPFPNLTMNKNSMYCIAGLPSVYPFCGLLNEVSLWTVCLSAEQIQANMNRPLVGSEIGLVGYWPLTDRFGTTAVDRAGTNNATLVNCQFTVADKGSFTQSIYVNGAVEASQQVTDGILPVDGDLFIGSGDPGDQITSSNPDFLQGTVGQVRLWNLGRMGYEIAAVYAGEAVPADAEGLVSAWYFETGSGSVAFDSKSDNNATIFEYNGMLDKDAVNNMWVPVDFKSAWTLFVNGVESAIANFDQISPQVSVPAGASQLSLGAVVLSNNLLSWPFSGVIAEVRLWNELQTAAALASRMYHPISGQEPSLIGYWPINTGSGKIIADLSPYGNNGVFQPELPTYPWQTYPDGPSPPARSERIEVVAVPGGWAGKASAQISGTPAVVEYGELLTDAAGLPTGILSWCYAYVDQNNALNLLGDYRVGDLDVQYVGQVQTNPTVVGYIEGAPPLPSENLTVDSPITPYKYLAASAITLTDAENTVITYTASRDAGFDAKIDGRIGFAFGVETSFIAAPGGIGPEQQVLGYEAAGGFRAVFDWKHGWLSGASITTDLGRRVDKGIDVFGAWHEPPRPTANQKRPWFENVPRYYVPNNKGLAMVKSGTADLYALRMKGSGALVAYSMRPSPDIPEDINLIMFVIDPKYVKNGTLDGWLGFEPDPDYKDLLLPGMYGSYFKPLEAYALKRQIEREQNMVKTYYEQFKAPPVTAATLTHLTDPEALTNMLMRYEPPAQQDTQTLLSELPTATLARRNLMNTYVWNSDGGLYAEEEQFAAVTEESSGEVDDSIILAGGYFYQKMLIGVEYSLDVLFGGHFRTQTVKTKNEGASFGISTKLSGEGFLSQRLDKWPGPHHKPILGAYPVPYLSGSAPGKVNQYRFMTFYLAPKKSNFDELSRIIDQNWLNSQGPYLGYADPDAFALRQALNNTNEVWRVLHRVTYVNRIAATGNGPQQNGDGESLAPDVQRPGNDSLNANALLIALLPVPQGDPKPMQTISSELQTLLVTWEGQPNQLWQQEVQQQQAQITTEVMTYMLYRQYSD